MHKESSMLCQCLVDANAIRIKFLCQEENVNSHRNSVIKQSYLNTELDHYQIIMLGKANKL